MIFLEPDPARYRISDCGRCVIEKIATPDGPRYVLWRYSVAKGGFASLDEARQEAMTIRTCPSEDDPLQLPDRVPNNAPDQNA